MKKFFVTKSDASRVAFIQQAIASINPDHVFVLCEPERLPIYQNIGGIKLPLKELNKAAHWITFVNTFTNKSLLVIDNVLKFIYFGDGKKKYLKDISQSIGNIIVTDVVPFYTEPHEIFYPFWFLGKEILGYNSYHSFKANHWEEHKSGAVSSAHSFEILRDKIKEFYVQDYDDFFSNVRFYPFSMTEAERRQYENIKQKAGENFSNPIKLYSDVSEAINLIDSRYNAANTLLKKLVQGTVFDVPKVVIVNNSAAYISRHRKRLGCYNFLTFHDKPSLFEPYKIAVLLQLPVVKPYNIFYILSQNQMYFVQLVLQDNKLENYFFEKIYNNELRKQFDRFFYNAHL
jgi:hypothetical protein